MGIDDEIARQIRRRWWQFFGPGWGCAVVSFLLLTAALIVMVVVAVTVAQLLSSDDDPEATAAVSVPAATVPIIDLEAPVGTPSGTAAATSSAPVAAEPPPATAPLPEAIDFPDLVPAQGTWHIDNLAGVADCGTIQVPIAPRPETGRLAVAADGSSVTLDGFGGETGAVTLQRTAATPRQAVYTGQLDPSALGGDVAAAGGSFSIDFTVVFDSPTRVTGLVTGTVAAEGFSCTVQRASEGSLVEGEGGTIAELGLGAAPAVANCDADDATPPQVVTVDDAVVAPTPHAALAAFLESADPAPPATTGFTEYATDSGVFHFVAFSGSSAYVAIRVEAAGDGFAVTRWDASAC